MNLFRQMFSRRKIFDDLSEEIEQHLEEKTAALMADGMGRREAAARARKEFGNVARIEERGREPWMWQKTERALADLRFAFRRLRRSPGFTATAVVTLALGIAANVIVFALLNGLLLHPLDVPDPGNLYGVVHGKDQEPVQSYRDYVDFRDRDGSFSGMIAATTQRVGLKADETVLRSWGLSTSSNYFDVLGVQPAVGRFFHAAEEHGPGSMPLVVLSYELWTREFARRAEIVGQTVEMNKHPMIVIGVAPEGFYGTDTYMQPDYWFPQMNAEQVTGSNDLPFRDHYGFMVYARLKPGVTVEQANESLKALTTQMAKEDKKDEGLVVRLAKAGPAPNTRSENILLGIMALAALVLVAACVNLASIFAARAADRSGELAVRMAIGSSRWGVLRELLAEALVASIAGGAVGVACAWAALRGLSHWRMFADMPVRTMIAPDAKVYVVALLLSLASGLLFGLLPARQVWKTDVVEAIKTGSQQSETFRGFAVRDVLLLVQIVVCTLLVTASLVAVRGMQRALRIPLGFDPRGVTTLKADLRMAGYTDKTAQPLFRKVEEAAAAIPGVSAVAVTDALPFEGNGDWFVYRDGTTEFTEPHRVGVADTFLISPNYLAMAGTRLMAGRGFAWSDDGSAPRVALINQTLARKVFGEDKPLGRHFLLWQSARYEVVGVVEDGKYGRPMEDPRPAMFFPLAQGVGGHLPTRLFVSVRSQLPDAEVAAALKRVVGGIDANLPVVLAGWQDAVEQSMWMDRAVLVVLAVLGVLAAMLAVTGVFGMASYSVAKRMKEQGIRIALGARHLAVMKAMLSRPVGLLLVGATVGMVLGVTASSVMAKMVALASPKEPGVLATVFGVMVALGVVATAVPARRTMRVDPARLLRE